MVMGGETEYAISATRPDGTAVDQPLLLGRCWEHAKATLGYSSTSIRGRFLRNGGLVYLDAGLHLEWSTPETTSPFEVVRYLAAGDRIVAGIAERFAAAHADIAAVFCSRTNVDYLSDTLWAAHESYGIGLPVESVQADLVPFLASRVVFGSGGWNRSAPLLAFTMSPRAHFLNRLNDRDSQYVRPLFHIKDEPLASGGRHRLHVACGESLCSQRANVLRFGTTALVAALAERGWADGRDVSLASPVLAAQRFASDPSCQTRVPLSSGLRASALDIQRHYLGRAELHLEELNLPWAGEICRLWRQALDDLVAGDTRLGRYLDWAIKRRLFSRYLEQRGISWHRLDGWNAVLGILRDRWGSEPDWGGRFNLKAVLNPDHRVRSEMDQLVPSLERWGLSWAGLADAVAARDGLFELDARFGSLGEDGLFGSLERAGALDHIVRPFDVDDAVVNPPRDTRAGVRGDVVWRLSQAGTSYGAEWYAVYDHHAQRELLIHDPLTTAETWQELPADGVSRRRLQARA